MRAGQADAACRIERQRQRALALCGIRRRHDRLDQFDRGVDEHARCLAIRRALDAAADGLPAAGEITAGCLHRGAVRPVRMAIDALEPDRAIRKGRVEIGRGREFASGPAVLVPAASKQPGLLRQAAFEAVQACDHLLLARAADQIGAQQRETEPHDVAMGIDEPGNDGRRSSVDALRARILPAQVGHGADGQHAARLVPSHRGHGRLRRIERMDTRRAEQLHVGHGRPSEHEGEQQ